MSLSDKFEPELISLDIAKDQHIFGGKLKQRDINTRRRKLQFTYDGKPIDIADTTCTAYVKKPTGELEEMNCQVNGDYVVLDFPTSTRAVDGEINVEVKLATADDDVSTFSLDFEVVPSLIDDRAIQSSNEFTALQELIAAIGGITDIPKDLALDKLTSLLYLIDAQGNKIGNGVTLDGLGGGDCDVPKLCVVCGDKQDGDTSDAQRIQRAIDSSQMGDTVLFPKGDITIDQTITLKPNRRYVGHGWATLIKAADNANLAEMIGLPHSTSNYTTVIENMRLDGNKANNGSQTGLYIGSMVHSFLKDIYVTYCTGTGIYIDGNKDFNSNTSNIINCRTYGNGRFGLYISEWCMDMHILQGDYGMNQMDGMYLRCPSSSVRDVTVWGNMGNGLYLEHNATSMQIWNNQIEGNAQNGIFTEASFGLISGNKIYDNANIPANYGKYDGIYVNASETYKDKPLEGISILNNKIFGGLYQNTGIHRYGLAMDKHHKNFAIYGNDFFYQNNWTMSEAGKRVYGINETDKTDYNWCTAFATVNMSADQNATAYADTKINFDTASVDIDGNYSGGKLVIKDAGYYKLHCNIHVDNASATSYNTLSFYVNNANISRVAGAYGGGTNFLTLSGSTTLYLEVGDEVEVYFRSTENVSINSASYLSSVTLSKA